MTFSRSVPEHGLERRVDQQLRSRSECSGLYESESKIYWNIGSSGKFHALLLATAVRYSSSRNRILLLAPAYRGRGPSQPLEGDRFGFEPEVTIKIARRHLRVYEVGISYSGRTYAEGKKIGWKDGVRAIWCLTKYGLKIPSSCELDTLP